MSRPSPTGAAPASNAALTTATAATAPELAELLRSVLLSVRNSPPGAASVQPLTTEAGAAIEQFRAIDAALTVATVFAPAPASAR
jgi:hypothetical protein